VGHYVDVATAGRSELLELLAQVKAELQEMDEARPHADPLKQARAERAALSRRNLIRRIEVRLSGLKDEFAKTFVKVAQEKLPPGMFADVLKEVKDRTKLA